jgi:hypothetical protein
MLWHPQPLRIARRDHTTDSRKLQEIGLEAKRVGEGLESGAEPDAASDEAAGAVAPKLLARMLKSSAFTFPS